MYKKFLFIIIFILAVLVKGGNEENITDNNISSNEIIKEINNETNSVETTNRLSSDYSNNKETLNNKNTKVDEEKIINETKKDESTIKNISVNTNINKEENNKKVNQNVILEIDTKENITEETIEESNEEKEQIQIKEESTKEVIEYNDAETRRMVNDINLLAKQNPDLWDKNGNPLYEVRIDKSAMNGEYMYPYSIDRIRGKVLNVFPVRFLVYVVDIQRPGFQKEMKYYILVTNL